MPRHSTPAALVRSFAVRSAAALVALAAPLSAQAGSTVLVPGDTRVNTERIRAHTATHRLVQYGESGETEVGRLSRRVERVRHTADEPAILVSMQFRNPTRSGLDIVYLDAETLQMFVRYLTAPTGLTTVFVVDDQLRTTYVGRNGTRLQADTTLAMPRMGGATDLVLASLDLAEGETVEIPLISGSANTLAGAFVSERVTYLGREPLEIGGVWRGTVRRFRGVQANGNTIEYSIAEDGPHLIRQDFHAPDGRRFLRWDLAEYGEG